MFNVKKNVKGVSKLLFKKIGKKLKRKLLFVVLPFIILITLVCSLVDFFFYHVPTSASAAENAKLKNFAIETTDKANVSDLKLEDGTKLSGFCDVNGKDLQLAVKWSDLYAMLLFEDNVTLESLNAGDDYKLAKERFSEIANELAPSITYLKGNRKVTLTTIEEEKDEDGNVISSTPVTTTISDETLYYIKNADTLYGKYAYEYEEKTDVKTDSEGTWTTTYLELSNSTNTDEFTRLDNYLKEKFSLTSQDDIEETRRLFIETSKGIYSGDENIDWLGGSGVWGNGLSWLPIDGINIDPKIMQAIMDASSKYSIPPWLIMGFIYRESNFRVDVMSCDDLGKDVKVSEIKNIPEYMNHSSRSLGLMQVTLWKDQCSLLGYDHIAEALNPSAQIDVGCNELINQKFKLAKINASNVDWTGDGWVEQTWLGCQAYNGLIYYNSNPQRTKEYAFSQYLRRPDGTGVFDMAEKYKAMFQINSNGEYVKNASWPAPGYHTITSNFGWREHPISHKKSHHDGIDIGAPMSSTVISASNGIVIQAKDSGNAYGKCVIVRTPTHDYLYGHLSQISVNEGDNVMVGAELGKVGSTGYSTGPHLHFGVSLGGYQNGNWVDPLSIISH